MPRFFHTAPRSCLIPERQLRGCQFTQGRRAYQLGFEPQGTAQREGGTGVLGAAGDFMASPHDPSPWASVKAQSALAWEAWSVSLTHGPGAAPLTGKARAGQATDSGLVSPILKPLPEQPRGSESPETPRMDRPLPGPRLWQVHTPPWEKQPACLPVARSQQPLFHQAWMLWGTEGLTGPPSTCEHLGP